MSAWQLTGQLETDASLAYSWAGNMKMVNPSANASEARLGLSRKVVTGAVPGWYCSCSSQHRGGGLMKAMWWAKDFDSSAGFAVASANAAYRVNK